VHVVESGGISKAAGKLRIAKSAVSRRLGLLEERYGTKLINRTPSIWNVTTTGHELYQRAMQFVGGVDEIEDDFVNVSADISGPLSISVPRDFRVSFLVSTLIAFKENYPEIQLSVDFDDRTVDLSRENYDFAIRITGELNDSSSEERIGSVGHRLYASHAYFEAHSEPQNVDELRHDKLLHFGTARRAVWDFVTEKGKSQPFELQPFVNSISGVFLLEATLKGLEIGRLPDFIVSDILETGQLIPVLPTLFEPDWGIYLVHSEGRRDNRRMRLFAEEMKRACFS